MPASRSPRRPVFVLACLLGWTGLAFASPSEQVPVGPRAIARGGAYASLALDASALFWNPAGLARIGHQELAGSYANLFQSEIKDTYAAFILPISRRTAVGADWYRSGFHDSELDFGENRFGVAVSTQFDRRLSVGATARYLTRDTDLDGSTVDHGTGFGMDFGILATPIRGLRIGVTAQDAFDTEIHQAGGTSSIAYPRNVRFGASYDYADRATLAFDVDDRWHAGAEFRALDLLALRAGFEKDRQGTDGATLTAGAGVRYGIFRVDYAYVIPPTLSATSYFGLSLAFNFNPALVRIERIEPDEIFASQSKSYTRVPIARANLVNIGSKMLDARLRVDIPGYTTAPSESSLKLDPGASRPVLLYAALNDRPMRLRENDRLPLRVSVSYNSERLVRTDRMNGSVTMYAPEKIDWGRGVDQAVAFVTSEDPVVEDFARTAIASVTESTARAFPSTAVANAAAIFDAVSTLGVRYVPDPNNPYPKSAGHATFVDQVSYPRHTLARRTGDCDDTTVLIAALLENVGIATKLVDVPKHLFLLFDTDRHERDLVGLEDKMFVRANQGLWIPLETTLLNRGFAEAWQEGADNYAKAARMDSVNLVDVQEAKTRYEANLPQDSAPVIAVDTTSLGRRVAAEGSAISGWREEYITTHFRDVLSPNGANAGARDVLAQTHYFAGRLDEALRLLEPTADAARSPRRLNNRGDVLAASGDLSGALASYAEAAVADPSDAGIWLNRGVVASLAGDSASAENFLGRGLENTELAEACRLLGLRPESGNLREGTARMSRAQLRGLLRAALAAIPRADSLRARAPSPTRPRNARAITGGPRGSAAEPDDVRLHLYWRERE
jgi:tetratricopeptide (TPR) repeat protein